MTSQQPDQVNIGRRFIEQVVFAKDMAVADELLAPDVVVHTAFSAEPIVGRESYKQALAELGVAFPDVRLTFLEGFNADGGRVVMRFESDATHTGDAFGTPATGRRIRMNETHVLTLREGRIIENYASDHDFDFGLLFGPALQPADVNNADGT